MFDIKHAIERNPSINWRVEYPWGSLFIIAGLVFFMLLEQCVIARHEEMTGEDFSDGHIDESDLKDSSLWDNDLHSFFL